MGAINREQAISEAEKILNSCASGKAWAIAWMLRKLPAAEPDIVRCKDCKYFEYDHPYIIQGVPILGHLVCNKWGDGCRTEENGFCFLAEKREGE